MPTGALVPGTALSPPKHTHARTHTCTDIFCECDFITHQIGAVASHTFHRISLQGGRALGVTPAPPKGEAGKQQLLLLPFLRFFASKTQIYSVENQIKDALPWQAACLFIYLSEHNHRHTGERQKHTLDVLGVGGLGWWRCSVISRTWLYNWSLIDMKSAGLAQVVFYTVLPDAGRKRWPPRFNLGAIF